MWKLTFLGVYGCIKACVFVYPFVWGSTAKAEILCYYSNACEHTAVLVDKANKLGSRQSNSHTSHYVSIFTHQR